MRDRKNIDLNWRLDGDELGLVEGGASKIRIYCVKNIFLIKIK